MLMVRPWKLPSITITFARPSGTPLISWPHRRATLSAVSTPSAPEFMGSTVSLPANAASSAQNGPSRSWWNALLVRVSRSSCSLAAATRSGCRWPKFRAEYAASMSR